MAKIEFGVSSLWLVGNCKKCKQPTTGELKTDNTYLTMICVNCYAKHEYSIKEDDRNFGYVLKGKLREVN